MAQRERVICLRFAMRTTLIMTCTYHGDRAKSRDVPVCSLLIWRMHCQLNKKRKSHVLPEDDSSHRNGLNGNGCCGANVGSVQGHGQSSTHRSGAQRSRGAQWRTARRCRVECRDRPGRGKPNRRALCHVQHNENTCCRLYPRPHRSRRGKASRRIVFTEHDLVTPFEATRPHVGPKGMSIEALCEAAITLSDSTAANLLLTGFGGPAALTAYLRSLGDRVTRVDRFELALNIVKPGENHDTTTPRAMVGTLRRLLLEDALSDASRAKLTNWMVEARDAATRRLRVGLPPGWRIANKPGTWEGISTNDIGVIWPPDHEPIVVAAYLGNAPGSVKAQEGILADVAKTIAEQV